MRRPTSIAPPTSDRPWTVPDLGSKLAGVAPGTRGVGIRQPTVSGALSPCLPYVDVGRCAFAVQRSYPMVLQQAPVRQEPAACAAPGRKRRVEAPGLSSISTWVRASRKNGMLSPNAVSCEPTAPHERRRSPPTHRGIRDSSPNPPRRPATSSCFRVTTSPCRRKTSSTKSTSPPRFRENAMAAARNRSQVFRENATAAARNRSQGFRENATAAGRNRSQGFRENRRA